MFLSHKQLFLLCITQTTTVLAIHSILHFWHPAHLGKNKQTNQSHMSSAATNKLKKHPRVFHSVVQYDFYTQKKSPRKVYTWAEDFFFKFTHRLNYHINKIFTFEIKNLFQHVSKETSLKYFTDIFY